jgi:phosphoribosylanthranilate isomerase
VGVFVDETVERIHRTVQAAGLTAVQLHGAEDKQFSLSLFKTLANGGGDRPTIFRSCPAHIFDKPAQEPVGWDPVAVGLVEPDEAYKGKRVHKLHVAQNGDLFLETHGFRPGVIAGILLDSSTATQPGGSGRTFDWESVQPWAGVINSISKLIVAGGLHPGNVQNAIHLLHPWGVDVSTGVESEHGKKDQRKMRAFIHAVHAMDEAN